MISSFRLVAVTASMVVAALSSPLLAQGALTQGAVADLGVTIASVEPCGKYPTGAIVTMKVANKGKVFAEPLVFEVAPKEGQPVVLRRCPGPYASRYGRAAPPGGTQTYQVLHSGVHALLAGAKAKVVDASFFTAAPPPEPPCEVGRPRTEKRMHELGATIEYAVLPLRNLRDFPIDVTLRATFDRPLTETILVHRRLKPKEAIEASFSDLLYDPPGQMAFESGSGWSVDFVVPRGASIGSAKIVDWCCVWSAESGDAAALFREAYAPWLRWEGTPFGVSGLWTAVMRPDGGAARTSRGKFGVSAAGAVAFEADGASAEDSPRIKRAVQTAFEDVRRPPVDEAVALCKPRMERAGPPAVIACADAWNAEYKRTTLAIEGGRFLGSSWMGGKPTDLHVEWKLEPFEGGYVVAERRAFNISGRGKPTEVHRWRYARSDGLLVPAKYAIAEDLTPVAQSWSLEIAFHDVKRDAAAGAPVASLATETVRGAWNSGYRYPGSRITCTCRFFAKPGKDGLWRGVKEVKGRITFTDWDGHSSGTKLVEVDGVPDEALRNTLAWTVEDRVRMWTGRDFAARGSFDTFFAGASFAERESTPGVFDVTNGPYSSIAVKDGRIAGLAFLGGGRRVLTWSKVGDQQVVTRVITGPEDLTATYVSVGPLLVPSRMVFKGVFGDEKSWGTEELHLTDFKLR